MKDIPVPVEALNDVLPGSPWQPEPAARYNALNALLRQEGSALPAEPAPCRGSEVLLPVCNITDELLPGNKAVEISPDPRPGTGINSLRPMLFGQAVSEECRFWGIATEDIAPGHGGLVQVGGAAVIRSVHGTPDRYIVPKPDGYFHFASTGRAEVIYRTSSSLLPDAMIYLGGGGNEGGYTGMFRVTENGTESVTIGGGMVILSFNEQIISMEGATLSRPGFSGPVYVLLNAVRTGGTWNTYFSVEGASLSAGYVPGERICWQLARLTYGDRYPFVQMWQGGVIDFTTRYFLS